MSRQTVDIEREHWKQISGLDHYSIYSYLNADVKSIFDSENDYELSWSNRSYPYGIIGETKIGSILKKHQELLESLVIENRLLRLSEQLREIIRNRCEDLQASRKVNLDKVPVSEIVN